MTFTGKIAVCLAGGLVLGTCLRADDLALTDNPYSSIVQRNVFGLNPPTPVVTESSDPAPKITAQGIQNFFGKVEVLFKVSGVGKPGQPPKDQYYTLSQGQRQDDIEVTKIDEKNGIVTFKNHGITQEVALATPPSSGPSLPPLPINNPGNMNPAPGIGENGNGPRNFGRFGQRGGGFNGRGNNNNNGNNGATGASPDLNLRSIPTRIYQPEAPQMTPEESALKIEQQRAAALDNNDPTANLFPTTPLTKQLMGE
jgi:hypothetical protein